MLPEIHLLAKKEYGVRLCGPVVVWSSELYDSMTEPERRAIRLHEAGHLSNLKEFLRGFCVIYMDLLDLYFGGLREKWYILSEANCDLHALRNGATYEELRSAIDKIPAKSWRGRNRIIALRKAFLLHSERSQPGA